MGGNGIHIAAVQRRILYAPIFQTDNILELRDIRLSAFQKDLLWLAGGLYGNGLAVQVAHGVNVACCIDGDDLPADHVGAGPLVILLTPVHGEAAPNAVDLPAIQQRPFLLPVDGRKHRLIAHPPESFGCDLHIDTGWIAVIVQIDEGRIGVAADGDLRQRRYIRLPCCLRRAAAERSGHKQNGQNK